MNKFLLLFLASIFYQGHLTAQYYEDEEELWFYEEEYFEHENNVYGIIPIDSSKARLLENEQVIIENIYAYMFIEEEFWVKTSPVEVTEDYCEYYNLYGDWQKIGFPEEEYFDRNFEHPVNISDGRNSFSYYNKTEILDIQHRTLVDFQHSSLELLPDIYLLNYDYKDLNSRYIPEYLIYGEYIYNANTKTLSEKGQYYLSVLPNGNILEVQTPDSSANMRILDLMLNPLTEMMSPVQLINEYNLAELTGLELIYDFPNSVEEKSILYNLFVLNSLADELTFSSTEHPFYDAEIYPYIYSLDYSNYRCFDSPGNYSEFMEEYQDDNICSFMKYHEQCEFTGGPVMCYGTIEFLNYSVQNNFADELKIDDVFKNIYDDEIRILLSEMMESQPNKEDLGYMVDQEYLMELDLSLGNFKDNFLLRKDGISFNIISELDYQETVVVREFFISYDRIKKYLKKDFKKLIG